jgi:DNA-binding PadR family transcriptional regulator
MPAAIVPRDHLAACLLLVLAEQPAHGYDLPALLAPLGVGVTDRGMLYRYLRSLEQGGLLASVWDPSPSGPARRTYRVTPQGRAWAEATADAFRQADRHMSAYLGRYRRLRRRGIDRRVGDIPAAG